MLPASLTMLPASASSGDRGSPPPISRSLTRSSPTPAWAAAIRSNCSPSRRTSWLSTPAARCCLPGEDEAEVPPNGLLTMVAATRGGRSKLAQQILSSLSPEVRERVIDAARQAFTSGFATTIKAA
jgi:hypothetical protein